MHQTPGIPGTSPVTDNPNPKGSQGMDTYGPGTDSGPRGSESGAGPAELDASQPGTGGVNPTSRIPGREGGGDVRENYAGSRTFRCSDVGNADCRWEVTGRTEDELMPKIEQHGREAHGITSFDGETRNKLRNAIRERRAA